MLLTVKNGYLIITDREGKTIIDNITCGVRGDSGAFLLKNAWVIGEDSYGTYAENGASRLRFDSKDGELKLSLRYVHEDEDIAFSDELLILSGKLTETDISVYGSAVGNYEGVRVNEMLTDLDTHVLSERGKAECGDYAIVNGPDGSFFAGCVTSNEYFGGFFVSEDGTFEARQYTEGREIKRGDVLTSDVVMLMPSADPEDSLIHYCDTVAALSDTPPRKKFDVPSGYCTWYYYFNGINDTIIDRTITEIAEEKERLPVRYVQIDDGWQVCYGQWEENEKFAKGMKAHAERIKAEGFTPGLWFAPLWAKLAKIRTEHPEYFAVDRRNGEVTKTLDLSVPEVKAFISEIFRRATYDWGYRYLKLDLITACFGAYRFRDPSFNSMKNYKECLHTIIASIPEDTFILGCTSPFAPVVGLVDGIRTSCDIGGDWDSVRQVFNRVLNRLFYHKRLFICDADCLIIRKPENEDSECRRNCTRTDEEIKSYISATAASGGILMLSDKLSLLDDEQKKMISYVFPQNKDAAKPLDFTEDYIPGVLDCGKRGSVRTIMLINWNDEERVMGVDTEAAHVFEFWSRSYRGRVSGRYESVIKPHSVEVLFLTECEEPAVIGTDSVLIPKIDQSFADGKLKVSFAKNGESLYVIADELSADGCSVEKLENGLYKVTNTENVKTVTLNTK